MDTIVELALPDGPLSAPERTDPFCSKLGGEAALLYHPSPSLKAELSLQCGICGNAMPLLLQMDCPWPDAPEHDRVVYVFLCNRRLCTEHPDRQKPCWRAFIMAAKKKGEKEADETASQVKKGLWDGVESSWNTAADKVEVSLSQLNLTEAKEEKEGEVFILRDYGARPFPAERLHIEEEMIRETKRKTPTHIMPEATGEEWSGEQYEQMQLAEYSKAFKRFTERVRHYPQQCVRFSPGGQPLSFAQTPLAPPPACSRCGRERQFELQLMPAILSLLPCHDPRYAVGPPSQHPLFGDGMEWGSLYLYSCGVCTGEDCLLIDAHLSIHTEQDA